MTASKLLRYMVPAHSGGKVVCATCLVCDRHVPARLRVVPALFCKVCGTGLWVCVAHNMRKVNVRTYEAVPVEGDEDEPQSELALD